MNPPKAITLGGVVHPLREHFIAKRRSTREPPDGCPLAIVIIVLHLLTVSLIGIGPRIPTQAIVDINLSEIEILRLDTVTIALLAAMVVSQTLIPTKASRKHYKTSNLVAEAPLLITVSCIVCLGLALSEASAPHSLVNITLHLGAGVVVSSTDTIPLAMMTPLAMMSSSVDP